MWQIEPVQTEIRKASNRYSLYHQLIAKVWAGPAGELPSAPFNRLCTLARKMNLRYVVTEDASRWPHVDRELAALQASVGTAGIAKAVSVSFLYKDPRSVDAERSADGLIGQAVVVTFPDGNGPRSYVFEAIFRRPQLSVRGGLPLMNNYLPFIQKFSVRVAGRLFSVEGIYFCQGNGHTSTSTDAALRTTMHWLTGTLPTRGWPLDVASGVPGAGSEADISRVLQTSGANFAAYGLDEHRSADLRSDAWSTVAAFVESGRPVLLVARTHDNQDVVLPVFGYTTNPDEWHPSASAMYDVGEGVLSSSLWIDHLIVHDPNIGPYLCLSRAWFDAASGRRLRPRFIVAPMEQGTRISPAVAERIAGVAVDNWLGVLADEGRGRWWQHLVLAHDRKVLRTTRVNRDDYRTHLHKLCRSCSREADLPTLDVYVSGLPNELWLCEVSLPQLFLGNRKKLGEVLLRADADPNDASLEAIAGFRFPSLLAWRLSGNALNLRSVGLRDPVPLLYSSANDYDW